MKKFPWILFASLSLFQAHFSAESARAESVSLFELDGGAIPLYRIDGSFEVPATRGQVWDVLTDYSALKGVVSSMQASCVLKREGTTVLVEQVALGRFLFFRRSIRLILKVEEEPQELLRFEETSGKPFRSYKGSWTLSDVKGGIAVAYRLEVSRADMAPPFIERGLFQDNAKTLLHELKNEISRRVTLTEQQSTLIERTPRRKS